MIQTGAFLPGQRHPRIAQRTRSANRDPHYSKSKAYNYVNTENKQSVLYNIVYKKNVTWRDSVRSNGPRVERHLRHTTSVQVNCELKLE